MESFEEYCIRYKIYNNIEYTPEDIAEIRRVFDGDYTNITNVRAMNFAGIFAENGRHPEITKLPAIEYYKKAHEMGFVGATYNYGRMMHKYNEFDEAEKYLNLALEKGFIVAHNGLGLMCKQLNKFDEAEKHFLIGWENKDDGCLGNLIQLYFEHGKYDNIHSHENDIMQCAEHHKKLFVILATSYLTTDIEKAFKIIQDGYDLNVDETMYLLFAAARQKCNITGDIVLIHAIGKGSKKAVYFLKQLKNYVQESMNPLNIEEEIVDTQWCRDLAQKIQQLMN